MPETTATTRPEGILDSRAEVVVAGDQQRRRRRLPRRHRREARLAAEGRNLHHHFAEQDVHQPEAPADDAGVAEDPADLLRLRVGGDIEILRLAAEQEIAHAAAHHVGEIPRLLQAIEDLQRLFLDPAAGDRVLGTGNDAR